MYGRSLHHSDEADTGSTVWRTILVSAFSIVVGVFLWERLVRPQVLVHDMAAQARTVTARGNLAADEKSTIELFREASPSVVHIANILERVSRDALRLNVMEIPQGTGTGIVWSSDGYIVTNFHVVRGGNAWRVTLQDHSSYDATFVGGAAYKDLAVLKIDAARDELPEILVGSSSDLEVGQKVFAIGNPFGLDQTLTTGVISGLDREIDSVSGVPIRGVIQTDAAINPGNSGGPLLDSSGRLIGINTAIDSPSGSYAGIGFAVPVDVVNHIVPEIIRKGRAARPGLGVNLLSDKVRSSLGFTQGALIGNVIAGSAAEEAGLRPTTLSRSGEVVPGDLILDIDGEATEGREDVTAVLADKNVGDDVQITVLRDGRKTRLAAKLQAIDDD